MLEVSRIGLNLERHHLASKVTPLGRIYNFQGNFVHPYDFISRNFLMKVVEHFVILPYQLESSNLDVCRRSYSQNMKTTQIRKSCNSWTRYECDDSSQKLSVTTRAYGDESSPFLVDSNLILLLPNLLQLISSVL